MDSKRCEVISLYVIVIVLLIIVLFMSVNLSFFRNKKDNFTNPEHEIKNAYNKIKGKVDGNFPTFSKFRDYVDSNVDVTLYNDVKDYSDLLSE